MARPLSTIRLRSSSRRCSCKVLASSAITCLSFCLPLKQPSVRPNHVRLPAPETPARRPLSSRVKYVRRRASWPDVRPRIRLRDPLDRSQAGSTPRDVKTERHNSASHPLYGHSGSVMPSSRYQPTDSLITLAFPKLHAYATVAARRPDRPIWACQFKLRWPGPGMGLADRPSRGGRNKGEQAGYRFCTLLE